ncbi:MAG: GIY-YIG nuclease family protein [Rickettsiales bacterium]|nr:GIY-YIG nuclease family protein [Rickettsiales bacterium]
MHPPKQPAVYIVTNKRNGTLYIGVTSNLIQRIYQHKHKLLKGFTTKYDCSILVYFELFEEMIEAISYEKKIKSGSRVNKLRLIEKSNPGWVDLYDSIL